MLCKLLNIIKTHFFVLKEWSIIYKDYIILSSALFPKFSKNIHIKIV